ncbi:MAG: hypothetical protein QOJ19_623, partial [Acidimicrobiia bacterium]|nr:hypothetical protein [Acidimicrobiia bacterium]
EWNFYLFAGFAVLGALLIVSVPKRPAATMPASAAVASNATTSSSVVS